MTVWTHTTARRVALSGAALAILLAAPAGAGPRETPPGASRPTEEVQKRIAAEYPELEKLYKHLHAHPELSLREEQSARRMAQELKALGFEVTENVGSSEGLKVPGVVGVLKNGPGPTVLVRADMDALPVMEQTGLAYASKVRVRDKDGNEVGVMHACGHDMQIS